MTTPVPQTLKIQRFVSVLLILLGLSLQVYMSIVEDEPGAVSLAMIMAGTAWFFYNRSRILKLID